MTTRIAIIGAGNMGGAFARGLATNYPEAAIALCDPNPEKLAAFALWRTTSRADEIIPEADIVLFAVKPQTFGECIEEITTPLSGKLIISIMAGVPIEKIRKVTSAEKIVRSMPNLGAQVGKGMTGWVATPAVTANEKAIVQRIFEAVGASIELPGEELINPLTSISGSGPAYFFLLCEELVKNAQAMGFSKEDAERLASQTCLGSALLLDRSGKTAEEWRKAVTSKGGTTEAALTAFSDLDFSGMIAEALERALKRAGELGGS